MIEHACKKDGVQARYPTRCRVRAKTAWRDLAQANGTMGRKIPDKRTIQKRMIAPEHAGVLAGGTERVSFLNLVRAVVGIKD